MKQVSSVAIARAPQISYPTTGDFSPSNDYPECNRVSSHIGQNRVYDLVRRCLFDIGADQSHFGTPDWNPLGEWIKPGQRVFILPNFVMHRRRGESLDHFSAKCTHASVLRPVMDYAVRACGDAHLVSFGNAPLQSCNYDQVARETCATALTEHYLARDKVLLGPFDLRQLISRWTRLGTLIDKQLGDPACAVPVDLGADSWLDQWYQGDGELPQIRVGDYPPADTMSYHAVGKHIYVINRRLLEADVIISVPKLKTHQKVGITCALKGTVGVIARKECLAHHRRGSPQEGGDEYPRSTVLHKYYSWLSDKSTSGGADAWSNLLRVQNKMLARLLRVGQKAVVGGAWFGNDTAWRMTLDIARVLRYARLDGTMDAKPQREHIGFVDGIVAGEGEGPLNPTPRPFGAVLFSPDVCALDSACASVMGFDPRKIPLILNGFAAIRYPLTESSIDSIKLIFNGASTSATALMRQLDRPWIASKGWRGSVELQEREVIDGMG